MEEIEVVFTNINIKEIEEKLKTIGAEKVSDIFYKIQIFDYEDYRLDKKGAWLRLRDDGSKITLSYKQRLGMNQGSSKGEDKGMKEIEIEVSDFEKAKQLILSLGLIEKFYQEKKRIRWKKGDVVFDIDVWPKLDPYLEIESDAMEKIDKAIKELGLDISKKRIINNFELYKEQGIDIRDYIKMSFDEWVRK